METPNLPALLADLERATGPSPELDESLMAAFFVRDERHIGEESDETGRWKPCKTKVWVDPKTDRWVGTHAYEFTASLDAALALVERVLPGWSWEVRRSGSTALSTARLWDPLAALAEKNTVCVIDAKRPALTLLTALLRALISHPEKESSHAG